MDTKHKLKKLNGLILSTKDYNEYDKILNILTTTEGKLTVYAFSVRRKNSKSIGKLRAFAFGSFELKVVQGSYQYSDFILKNSFMELTSDLTINCYASYFVELAKYFSYENIEASNTVNLLYMAFKALIKGNINIRLIKAIVELKMLQYEGIYRDTKDIKTDDETFVYTWNYILTHDDFKLFNFNVSDSVLKNIEKEISYDYKMQVNKKFKSLELLQI